MRPESLREAAGERQCKLRKRLSKGEKTSTRRMATVASVYTLAPPYRTPKDIGRDLDTDLREAVRRPRPEQKRYGRAWPRSRRRSSRRGRAARTEAWKAWVVLVDGNETQLRLTKETAARRGVKVTIQLNVIHVIE